MARQQAVPEEAKPKNYITTREARRIIQVTGFHISLTSLIEWCNKHNLGVKIGGRWYVDKDKLNRFLKKEIKNADEK